MAEKWQRTLEKKEKELRSAAAQEQIQPEDVIENRRKHLQERQFIYSFLRKLGVTVVVLVVVFTFIFGITVIHGEDMYPRLRDGDIVLYYRLADDYRVGDVVTFKQGDIRHTARIVAVGGDTVDLSADGELILNGNIQEEQIFYPTYGTEAVTPMPCTVTAGSYFLLSDFRTLGEDSRVYGTVKEDRLDGKIISVLRRRGI